MPLCRRGPEAIRPQPCGPMLMVVAPTILTPEVPEQSPAEDTPVASADATPTVTLTAASTAYEWNPTAAGADSPTRSTTGPLFKPAPMENANIPVLGAPGSLGGPLSGWGGSSGGLFSHTLAYNYYQDPNNFGAEPIASAAFRASPEASASLPGLTNFSPSVSIPGPDRSPEAPALVPAAVPEPASILATLTGMGVIAATASLRRSRRGVAASASGRVVGTPGSTPAEEPDRALIGA